MFAHYGRSETSFVSSISVSTSDFRSVTKAGLMILNQGLFPRYIEENEFVLMMEVTRALNPTGRERTLFVTYANEQVINMEVVTENPDEFWRKQAQTTE